MCTINKSAHTKKVWVQSQVESYSKMVKDSKMVPDASLLNTQHYNVRIKGKVRQSFPTHWCCSYRKGSLRVTLDFRRQLTFTYIIGALNAKTQILKECPCGVMVKAMDCGSVVSEFILQSRYHVHFRAKTLGKGMNPLITQLWVK